MQLVRDVNARHEVFRATPEGQTATPDRVGRGRPRDTDHLHAGECERHGDSGTHGTRPEDRNRFAHVFAGSATMFTYLQSV